MTRSFLEVLTMRFTSGMFALSSKSSLCPDTQVRCNSVQHLTLQTQSRAFASAPMERKFSQILWTTLVCLLCPLVVFNSFSSPSVGISFVIAFLTSSSNVGCSTVLPHRSSTQGLSWSSAQLRKESYQGIFANGILFIYVILNLESNLTFSAPGPPMVVVSAAVLLTGFKFLPALLLLETSMFGIPSLAHYCIVFQDTRVQSTRWISTPRSLSVRCFLLHRSFSVLSAASDRKLYLGELM